jgi:capsular exopolysaccharide synthesis family protein
LKRYLPSIKRYIWAIPILMVLAGIAGYGLGKAAPVAYTATSTMLVDVNRPDSYIPGQQQPSSDSLTTATNYSAEIPSRIVMTAIWNATPALKQRGYTVDDLLVDVSATPSTSTSAIEISATTGNINDSVLLANSVSTGFEKYEQSQLQQLVTSQYQSLQTQIAAYEKQKAADQAEIQSINNSADVRTTLLLSDISDLTHNIETLQSQQQQLPSTVLSNVFVVDLSTPLGVAASTRSSTLTILGSGVGFLLGSVLMLILIFLDERLRGADQVREKLGLAYVGGIFKNNDLKSSPLQPPAQIAQQLMDIGVDLRLTGVLPGSWHAPQGAVLLVTSARAAEGKTTFAAGLATMIARGGGTVVVIDGNLRKPTTHLTFGLGQGGPGLNGLLKLNNLDVVESSVQRTNVPGAWLLSGGKPADGAPLLLDQKLPAILSQLRKKTDVIIIDAPPLLSGADASLMATMVDGIVLVIDAQHDKLPVLLHAKDILHSLAEKPTGVVLNRLPRQRRDYYYATAYERKAPVVDAPLAQAYPARDNGNGNGTMQRLEPVLVAPLPRPPTPQSITVPPLDPTMTAPLPRPPTPQSPSVPLTPGGRAGATPSAYPGDASMTMPNPPSPRPGLLSYLPDNLPPPIRPSKEK